MRYLKINIYREGKGEGERRRERQRQRQRCHIAGISQPGEGNSRSWKRRGPEMEVVKQLLHLHHPLQPLDSVKLAKAVSLPELKRGIAQLYPMWIYLH